MCNARAIRAITVHLDLRDVPTAHGYTDSSKTILVRKQSGVNFLAPQNQHNNHPTLTVRGLDRDLEKRARQHDIIVGQVRVVEYFVRKKEKKKKKNHF